MKRVYTLAGSFFLSLTMSSAVFASDAKENNDSFKLFTSSNSIEIFTNYVSDHFEMISLGDGSKVATSSSSKIEVTNLQPGTNYKFKLISYDSNKNIVSEKIINAATKKSVDQLNKLQLENEKDLKNMKDKGSTIEFPMVNSQLNSVFFGNEVKLIWSDVPDEDNSYEIYKDDKLLTTVTGNEYIDTQVKPNEVYKYSVVGYKKVSDQRINQIQSELKTKNVKVNENEEKSLFYERKEVSSLIRTSDNTVLNSLVAKSGYILKYTTFIPLATAPNPWCDVPTQCQYDSFHGDNRGFDVSSGDFRTRSTVYVLWDGSNNNAPYISQSRYTGVTIGYKNGVEVGRAQAPADEDMRIASIEYGSNYIYHRMFLASNNPLVASPDIDAFYYAKVYNNGTGEYYGVHDQAPSHEFYIVNYPDESNKRNIHLFTHQGFDYLFPWTTKAEFNVTIY